MLPISRSVSFSSAVIADQLQRNNKNMAIAFKRTRSTLGRHLHILATRIEQENDIPRMNWQRCLWRNFKTRSNNVGFKIRFTRRFSTNSVRFSATTLDEEEVDKFSALAETWWREGGEFEALHTMNELRIPLIRDALMHQSRNDMSSDEKRIPSRPLDGYCVLDVGSGGGILSEPLARLGAQVTGVDASAENISVAESHAMHDQQVARNLKYIQSTVEDLLPDNEGRFDGVVASEVLEHVADVEMFVNACCKLTKPGGSLFVTTLNKTFLSYGLGIVAAERVLGLVAPGTHDWEKFIPPQELQYILDKNGFSTRLLHGMFYNPLTKRWIWTQDTSINYAVHAINTNVSPSTDAAESDSAVK